MWYFIGGAVVGLIVGFFISEARIQLAGIKRYVQKQKERRQKNERFYKDAMKLKEAAFSLSDEEVDKAKGIARDLVKALTVMGYKEQDARSVALKVMTKDHPTSIEDAITLAFKRGDALKEENVLKESPIA